MNIKVTRDDISTIVDVEIPGLVVINSTLPLALPQIRVYGLESIRFFSGNGNKVVVNKVGYRWDLSVKIEWQKQGRNLVYSGWKTSDNHYNFALGLDRGLMEQKRYPSDSARAKLETILNKFIPEFCREYSNVFENEAHLKCVRTFDEMTNTIETMRQKLNDLNNCRSGVKNILDSSHENIIDLVQRVRSSCDTWDQLTERSHHVDRPC